MNNRELQLQSIIKSLQNKILILKEENKIISERADNRFKQQAEEFVRLTAEKDRLIEYLKIEVMKDREAIMQEHSFYENSRNREKDDAVKELDKYRAKCSDLEKKIQKVTENYELKQKEMEEELLKLQERQFEAITARTEVAAQIDKLNKFYTNSRIEIPKRKETIEWTDKLLNFLSKNEVQSEKGSKQIYSFIKNSLETIKSEIVQSLKTATQSEDNSLKERRQIVAKIQEIVDEQNRTKKQIEEDNEKFWDAIKKEKAGTYSDRLQEQEKEFAEERKKLTDQNQQLTNKVKTLEAERKTLLLGFTQLKSLYESRQKTYREEIAALKHTIENLLANSEQREIQFEKQTKMLHSQLTSLNERYYENIEVPLFKMSSKLDEQIKSARQELQKLNQNKNFVKLVEKLDSVMQTYIFESSSNSRMSVLIAEHIKKSTEVVEWARMYAEEQAERLSQIEPIYVSNKEQNEHQVNAIECNLKQLEWKERENKFTYEITTLKKHNKKLKEYCDSLEAQVYGDGRSKSAIKRATPSKTTPAKQQPPKQAETSQKIIDLESEISKLTSINKGYESEFFYQVSAMKQHLQKLTGKEVKDRMHVIEMYKGINEISNFNEQLADFLQKENEHIDGIRQILSNLNNVLVKPVELFDRFVDKISNCCKTPQQYGVTVDSLQSSNISSKIFEKLRSTYQEISVKRSENTQQTNKLVSQLIKMLRDTAPLLSRPLNKSQIGVENIEKEKLDKSRMKESSNVEKKIKELQTCRIKSREEVIRKLEKIEEKVKNLEAKSQKKMFVGTNRIEELLQKKIEQCNQKAQGKKKTDPNDLTQITSAAMKELKQKLKESLTENEGLIKQMECLQLSKKREG